MMKQWKKQQIFAGIIVCTATINMGFVQAQQSLPAADSTMGETISIPRRFTNGVPIGVPVGSLIEDQAVNEVREYFQRRWRRDPNFNGYLQYHLTLQADGRVKSIVGIGNNSQIYLEYTNFLRSGDALVTPTDREHLAWIIHQVMKSRWWLHLKKHTVF